MSASFHYLFSHFAYWNNNGRLGVFVCDLYFHYLFPHFAYWNIEGSDWAYRKYVFHYPFSHFAYWNSWWVAARCQASLFHYQFSHLAYWNQYFYSSFSTQSINGISENFRKRSHCAKTTKIFVFRKNWLPILTFSILKLDVGPAEYLIADFH